MGGHQEWGKRAGTENTPYIIGLGKACELAGKNLVYYNTEVKSLRDKLENGIIKKVPNVKVNGQKAARLANTSNITFQNVEGESVLLLLNEQGIAASTGSACASGSIEPSRILIAMGISEIVAHGALRFSLSRFNTEEHIDHIINQIPPIIEQLRKISPFK